MSDKNKKTQPENAGNLNENSENSETHAKRNIALPFRNSSDNRPESGGAPSWIKRAYRERFRREGAGFIVAFSREQHLLTLGLMAIMVLGVMGAAESFTGKKIFEILSGIAEAVGLKEKSSGRTDSVVVPNGTLQLSKEYIYAGSRMLAIEDYNAAASTVPSPEASPFPAGVVPGTSYNPVADFSAVNNPAGVWSYGQKNSINASFTPHAYHGQQWAGIDNWSAIPGAVCCGMVAKNTAGTVQNYAAAVSHPPDLLNLHPGGSGEQMTVRWRAPGSGTYQIQGRFQGIDYAGGTTTDVHILHNNIEIWTGAINGHGAQAVFGLTLTVNAGETIDFQVGYGSNASYAYDSTGLAAIITLGSAAPAPTPTPALQPGGAAYNVLTDFSASNNPSGVWSYGQKNSLQSAFMPHPYQGQQWSGIDNWSAIPGGVCCGMIARNNTGSTQNYADAVAHPPDLLNLHPGGSGEYTTVRWTAPVSGTYRIAGRFQGIDYTGGTTTDVHILHNNSEVWAGNVNGFGAQAAFGFTINVSAGDTVDFQVGWGGNAAYAYDSTGLAVLISTS